MNSLDRVRSLYHWHLLILVMHFIDFTYSSLYVTAHCLLAFVHHLTVHIQMHTWT